MAKPKSKIKKLGCFIACLIAAAVIAPVFSDSGNKIADAISFTLGEKAIFMSDYPTRAAARQASADLNEYAAENSFVLMKNENSALPLAKGSALSIFGVYSVPSAVSSSSSRFAFNGSGSGGGYSWQAAVPLHTALRDYGFRINNTLRNYYTGGTANDYGTGGRLGIAPSRTSALGYTVSASGAPSYSRIEEDIYAGTTASSAGFASPTAPGTASNGTTTVVVKDSWKDDYNDAAIVVLRRWGTEGGEYSLFNTPGHSDPLDHYYCPQDNEMQLIDYAAANFPKVVVLINSANAMDLKKIEDHPGVDAILWIGYPGVTGCRGIAKILAGDASPSGRTPDAYLADIKYDPSWPNFAANTQTHLKVMTIADYKAALTAYNTTGWVWEGVTYTKPSSAANKTFTDTARADTELVAVVPADPQTQASGNPASTHPYGPSIPIDATTGTMNYRGVPPSQMYTRVRDMNGNLMSPQSTSFVANTSQVNLVDYEEGVYVGYRFYETAWEEGVYFEDGDYYNRTNGIIYPFGYGLSYTSFTQEIVGKALLNGQNLATNDGARLKLSVKVTNTGSIAGREVVQLYSTPPYTPGGIEKPHVSLIDFVKTRKLAPGESQIMAIDVVIQDVLASYDWNDANNNGFKGYELEAGDYTFSVRANSHDAIDSVTMKVAKDRRYTKDSKTGEEIVNLFSPDDGEWDGTRSDPDYYTLFRNEFVSPDSPMVVMSRADLMGTFPKAPTPDDLRFSDAAKAIIMAQPAYSSFNDLSTDPWWVDESEFMEGGKYENWTQRTTAFAANAAPIQLWDMGGVAYDDNARWDEFLNQMTLDEMKTALNTHSASQSAISSIGLPAGRSADGPSVLRSGTGTLWLCATNIAAMWDADIAYKIGSHVGEDSLWNNDHGWWGPALQLHRNGVTGRNFEYYAQDPILAAKTGMNHVKGATDKGTIVYMKHLFLNEQETNRYSAHTFADEQTTREVWLKPFEWTYKYGNANSSMSSYPSAGLAHPSANWNLYERLIAQEWGFKGFNITDYYNSDNISTNANVSIRCKQLPLNTWLTTFGWNIDGTWSSTLRGGKGGVTSTYSPGSPSVQTVNSGYSAVYSNNDTGKMYGLTTAGKVNLYPGAGYNTSGQALTAYATSATRNGYTQWYAIRECVKRVMYDKVHTNLMGNGLPFTPWISTATQALAGAAVGEPFNVSLLDYANVPAGVTLSFIITSGTLNAGLTLSENGIISGTPTAVGASGNVIINAYSGHVWAGANTENTSARKWWPKTFTISVAGPLPPEETLPVYDSGDEPDPVAASDRILISSAVLYVGRPASVQFSVNPDYYIDGARIGSSTGTLMTTYVGALPYHAGLGVVNSTNDVYLPGNASNGTDTNLSRVYKLYATSGTASETPVTTAQVPGMPAFGNATSALGTVFDYKDGYTWSGTPTTAGTYTSYFRVGAFGGTTTSVITKKQDVWTSVAVVFTVLQATATLDDNYGGLPTYTADIVPGADPATLPTPVRAGHLFKGWFEDASGVTPVTELTDGMTAYAKWAPSSLITFDFGYGAPVVVNAENGLPVTLLTQDRAGYLFKGWYAESTFVTPVTSLTAATDTTLYAKWYELVITLDFGYGPDTAVPVEVGETLILPTLARDGYIFLGWYAENTFVTPVTAAALAGTETDPVEVFAKWLEINGNETEALEILAAQLAQLTADGVLTDERIAVLEAQIVDITSRLAAAELSLTQIASIQASINSINASLNTLESMFDVYDIYFEIISGNIIALQDNVNARLDEIERQIAEMEKRLAEIEDKYNKLMEALESGDLKGDPGATWIMGVVAPNVSQGNDGDLYLDALTGDVYIKAAGAWFLMGNLKGPQGDTGPQGATGLTGATGANGKSAYELWKEIAGNESKTEAEFFASLVGATGATGSTGAPGADGATWYSGTAAPAAGTGKEGDFYLNTATWDVYKKGASGWGTAIGSIKGADGATGLTGAAGANGKSAYELWKEIAGNESKTEAEFFASLKGVTGDQGTPGTPGTSGADGATWYTGTAAPAAGTGKEGDFYLNTATWDVYNKGASGWGTAIGSIKGAQGTPGANGKSAYDLAVEGGFSGTVAQWLTSLKGETGAAGKGITSIVKTTAGLVDTYTITYTDSTTYVFTLTNGAKGTDGTPGGSGANGKSAYELAVENGFSGDVDAWLLSLVGATGTPGTPGTPGGSGAAGKGIVKIEKTGTSGKADTYTITYTDGATSTFTVTNGDDGAQGPKGEKGCGSSAAAIAALFSLLACAFVVVIKKQF